MPFVEKLSREIVDEAKHLVAFALATGGHFGLLACGGPGVAERAPLGKAIGFPKMFREPLCSNGTKCFTVPRHENRDFMRRLSKMQ
jgi:hypothetical protein